MVSVSVGLVCLTAIVLASLRFAEKTDPDGEQSRSRVIAEKRRILERDRAEWSACLRPSSGMTKSQKEGATTEISRIDKQLLALADEEGRR
jgi:hypothetical protein